MQEPTRAQVQALLHELRNDILMMRSADDQLESDEITYAEYEDVLRVTGSWWDYLFKVHPLAVLSAIIQTVKWAFGADAGIVYTGLSRILHAVYLKGTSVLSGGFIITVLSYMFAGNSRIPFYMIKMAFKPLTFSWIPNAPLTGRRVGGISIWAALHLLAEYVLSQGQTLNAYPSWDDFSETVQLGIAVGLGPSTTTQSITLDAQDRLLGVKGSLNLDAEFESATDRILTTICDRVGCTRMDIKQSRLLIGSDADVHDKLKMLKVQGTDEKIKQIIATHARDDAMFVLEKINGMPNLITDTLPLSVIVKRHLTDPPTDLNLARLKISDFIARWNEHPTQNDYDVAAKNAGSVAGRTVEFLHIRAGAQYVAKGAQSLAELAQSFAGAIGLGSVDRDHTDSVASFEDDEYILVDIATLTNITTERRGTDSALQCLYKANDSAQFHDATVGDVSLIRLYSQGIMGNKTMRNAFLADPRAVNITKEGIQLQYERQRESLSPEDAVPKLLRLYNIDLKRSKLNGFTYRPSIKVTDKSDLYGLIISLVFAALSGASCILYESYVRRHDPEREVISGDVIVGFTGPRGILGTIPGTKTIKMTAQRRMISAYNECARAYGNDQFFRPMLDEFLTSVLKYDDDARIDRLKQILEFNTGSDEKPLKYSSDYFVRVEIAASVGNESLRMDAARYYSGHFVRADQYTCCLAGIRGFECNRPTQKLHSSSTYVIPFSLEGGLQAPENKDGTEGTRLAHTDCLCRYIETRCNEKLGHRGAVDQITTFIEECLSGTDPDDDDILNPITSKFIEDGVMIITNTTDGDMRTNKLREYVSSVRSMRALVSG